MLTRTVIDHNGTHREGLVACDIPSAALRVAHRIEAEAYSGTEANTDWNSTFDPFKAAAIITEELSGKWESLP